MNKNNIVVLALLKVPPPVIGTTVAAEILLRESDGAEGMQLVHIDVSDHREASTLGRWDYENVLTALKQYRDVVKGIIRNRPDVIYYYSAQTGLAFWRDVPILVVGRLFRRKVVVHLHGGNFRGWYDQSNGIQRVAIKLYYKSVSAQIVLGETLRGQYDGLLNQDKVFVVRNGMRPLEECEGGALKQSPGLSVLYLSNFIREKGYFDLLEVVPKLAERFPEAKIVFVGKWRSGADKEEFEDYVKSHNLKCVRMYDGVYGEEKEVMLRSSSVFVLPSYYRNEGMPYSIVEALRAGLPIVSTKHAAITEMVIDGKNGFLVEKRDKEALLEAVGKVLSDDELRKSMSEESKRLFADRYSVDRMLDDMYTVFSNVCGRVQ